jgi:uncharacterized protein (TIGR03435 family)
MKHLFTALCALSLSTLFAAPSTRAQMPLPSAVQSESKDADVKLPDFDVASVKENKGDSHMMSWRYTPDGIRTINLSLANLIADAYNIKLYLISGGPSWVNSTSFDVDAKVDTTDVETFKKLSPAQRRLMLQKLLADRFHLAVHIETKTLPVYDLVIASGGSKLKLAAPDPPPPADANPSDPPPKPRGMMRMGPGTLFLQDMPLSSFVEQLSYSVGRTVINKTGLSGKYDLSLKWTPDDQDPADSGSDNNAPGLFTALQEQLGLKLEPSKGPVDTLIIDHVEMPTAN